MQKHKFNIFPVMQPDDYNRLRDDIRLNGYDSKNPIYIYEGDILDGWNRQRVCEEFSITPIYKVFTGTEGEAIDFVMRTNKRRNLDASQWSAIAVEANDLLSVIKERVEKERRERQSATQSKPFDNPKRGPIIIENESDEFFNQKGKEIKPIMVPMGQLIVRQPKNEHEHKTSHILAETFNTNRTYINEAAKLKRDRPELLEKVKSGEITIPQAVKQVKSEERKEQKVFESKQMPTGTFDLIYCDPPWRYDFAETDNRKIENQYPTMDVQEICDMKLPSIATNSLLLMWATAPKLLEALKVIDAWGFTYKTHGIWDKVKIGMGYWFRGQHEILIVATRGTFSPPEPDCRNSSIYTESRGQHSSKPLFYYDWIEKSFPLAHKIELFSRIDRTGWEAWGNE